MGSVNGTVNGELSVSVSTRRARDEVLKWDEGDFADFLDDVASGVAVTKRVSDAGVTLPVLLNWLSEDPEKYGRYQRALLIRTEVKALECEEIADGTKGAVESVEISSAKLRIDTRLKLAGKWNRERYGESVKVEGGGGAPLLSFVMLKYETPEKEVVSAPDPRGAIEAEDAEILPAPVEPAAAPEPAVAPNPPIPLRRADVPDEI